MAFYLSLLEGPTPAQAVSIFATGDILEIIKGVRRLIFERLDELDLYDEPEMPPLSIAPMQVVKRGSRRPMRMSTSVTSVDRNHHLTRDRHRGNGQVFIAA